MRQTAKFLTAMVFFGTISLFVRNIPLPSKEIAFFRGAIALVILLLFILITKQYSSLKEIIPQLPKLLLSGAFMGFNWILLFEAYHYTSVAIATLCYYFAPVLVLIFSTLLFKEHITCKKLLCFAGATLGLILMIMTQKEQTLGFRGILLGLGAALLYASVILLNKAIPDINAMTRTLFQFAAAIIILFPYILLTGGFHIREITSLGLINLLIVGVIHTGIMYVLYFSSLPKLKGQQAALLSYFDPLTAITISVLILKESITWLQLTGGALILVTTFLSERTGKTSL